MKNKLLLSSIAFALTILPLVSSAETLNTGASVKMRVGTSTEARLKANAEFELRKKELETRREELKAEMGEKREALKNEMDVKKETVKTEMEERREDVKNKIEDRKEAALVSIQERLNKFTQNIKERFGAAIERLEKLAARIDSRIVKMEAENIDVTKAKELMVIAKIKMETAKTSIAGIEIESGVISSSAATTTVAFKADFQKLTTQVEQAKKDIQAAHAALVEVVSNLKPGYNKNRTATSTATTTTP